MVQSREPEISVMSSSCLSWTLYEINLVTLVLSLSVTKSCRPNEPRFIKEFAAGGVSWWGFTWTSTSGLKLKNNNLDSFIHSLWKRQLARRCHYSTFSKRYDISSDWERVVRPQLQVTKMHIFYPARQLRLPILRLTSKRACWCSILEYVIAEDKRLKGI